MTTSSVTCSGSAVASTIIGLMPPVSAISGTIGGVLGRQRAVDRARHVGRAGEGDTGDAGIGDERGADLAVARHQLQHARRHARLVQNAHRLGRDQRRLLGRLRHHGVAGDERGAHLAEKDRERKIPRADADEDAAAAIAQLVRFAGRAGQRLRRQRDGALRAA